MKFASSGESSGDDLEKSLRIVLFKHGMGNGGQRFARTIEPESVARASGIFPVMELLLFAVALTAIGVLIGLGYGVHALRLMSANPNRLSLRLAALNLLEPSVTSLELHSEIQ